MIGMLFVHLPVQDLAASRAFYEALGLRANDPASDEGTVPMVLHDDIVVVLTRRDRFAGVVAGEVGDPASGTTVLHGLSVDSREEVDDLAERALRAGAGRGLPAQDDQAAYARSFRDPDGHAWQVLCLQQMHVIN